jgi:asparaginyl-tRNA synthetase
MSNGPSPSVSGLSTRVGETVTLKGWLYNRRDSGKIRFLVFRDGSGYLQCVVVKKEVPEEVWEASGQLTQESTLEVTGVVREAPRQEGGVELGVTGLSILSLCHDWPITPKEHGVDFLMSQRHLWLRSARQVAILKVRSEVESAIHDFYHSRGYTKVDSPILTPNACEGTSNLFETQYTEDEKAYLSQSGQLYLEPAAAALGKVYCFGPTFRAEKSKTRRHLREFWMVEPEVAFMEIDGLMDLAEEFVKELTARVLDRRREDLKRLERDTTKLEATTGKAFPRIAYRDAVEILKGKGFPVSSGTTSAATRRRRSPRVSTPPSWSRATRPRSSRSTCSPTRTTRRSSSASTCSRPRGTARSSAARSGSTTTTSSCRGSGSTSSPSRPSSGTST